MVKFFIALIVLIVFIEYYSVGVMILAKQLGEKDAYKCLIPFYAFYMANKISGAFTVLTIPVLQMRGMMISVCSLFMGGLLYACWGETNLPQVSSDALWEIMTVVMVLAGILFVWALVANAQKVYRRFNVKREVFYTLLSLPVVTIPLLYLVVSKNRPRTLQEMY